MLGLCELTTCRRQALLAYFGDVLSEPCGNCDNCLAPPYVVFHDASLKEMAEQRPQTLKALAGISGIGARKLETYGEAFLQVLRDHVRPA